MDIRECRRGLLVSRAAQRLSGRSAEPSTPTVIQSLPEAMLNPFLGPFLTPGLMHLEPSYPLCLVCSQKRFPSL